MEPRTPSGFSTESGRTPTSNAESFFEYGMGSSRQPTVSSSAQRPLFLRRAMVQSPTLATKNASAAACSPAAWTDDLVKTSVRARRETPFPGCDTTPQTPYYYSRYSQISSARLDNRPPSPPQQRYINQRTPVYRSSSYAYPPVTPPPFPYQRAYSSPNVMSQHRTPVYDVCSPQPPTPRFALMDPPVGGEQALSHPMQRKLSMSSPAGSTSIFEGQAQCSSRFKELASSDDSDDEGLHTVDPHRIQTEHPLSTLTPQSTPQSRWPRLSASPSTPVKSASSRYLPPYTLHPNTPISQYTTPTSTLSTASPYKRRLEDMLNTPSPHKKARVELPLPLPVLSTPLPRRGFKQMKTMSLGNPLLFSRPTSASPLAQRGAAGMASMGSPTAAVYSGTWAAQALGTLSSDDEWDDGDVQRRDPVGRRDASEQDEASGSDGEGYFSASSDIVPPRTPSPTPARRRAAPLTPTRKRISPIASGTPATSLVRKRSVSPHPRGHSHSTPQRRSLRLVLGESVKFAEGSGGSSTSQSGAVIADGNPEHIEIPKPQTLQGAEPPEDLIDIRANAEAEVIEAPESSGIAAVVEAPLVSLSSTASTPVPTAPTRQLPSTVSVDPTFPGMYGRFEVPCQVPSEWHGKVFTANAVSSSVFLSRCSTLCKVKISSATANETPITDPLNLYTPRYVRGVGMKKEGLCPLCFHSLCMAVDPCKPIASATYSSAWYKMKISAYNYHMQVHHGINHHTGRPLHPPVAFREVEKKAKASATSDRAVMKQGRCHSCSKWIDLQSVKEVEVKIPEIYWRKHAARCHKSKRLAGDEEEYGADVFVDNELYRRVVAAVKAQE